MEPVLTDPKIYGFPDTFACFASLAIPPLLNPREHVWDELREKEFPNSALESMAAVVGQLEESLPRLAANTQALRSLAAWPWLVRLLLNAH